MFLLKILKARHLLKDERGGTLAELAILVPFLVIMMAGVCEFGRYFQTYITLAKGTRSASRYLSSHTLTPQNINRATSLVVCGKQACVGGDELVKGFTANNVCIESSGSPQVTSVTVRIPRTTSDCTPMPNAGNAVPFKFTPIFDLGALLHTPAFTMALPIAPRTTMYYMNNP